MRRLGEANSDSLLGSGEALAAAPGKRTRSQALTGAAVQRSAVPGASPPSDTPPAAEGAADDPFGLHLPDATRAKMEASFGADFSDVRVAVGDAAPRMGAAAFAQGDQLAFAPGSYAPGSGAGDALIGHELAHVVQQRAGRVAAPAQGKGAPVVDDEALEREADLAGARAARGEPAGVGGQAGGAPQPKRAGTPIQRFEADEHKEAGDVAANTRLAGDPALRDVAVGKATLAKGATGAAVTSLQIALSDLGHPLPKYAVDGRFFDETAAAVTAFQQAAGLTASGTFDAAALKAMDARLGARGYAIGPKGAESSITLTHGDVDALSADVFPPDELFRLAAIPGRNGRAVGTSDEVVWALRESMIWEMREVPGRYQGAQDPRFQGTGPFAHYVFTQDVKDAVISRYRKLAARNTGHFVAPHGRDGKGNPIVVDPADSGENAGINYRSLHEAAIKGAYVAGKRHGDKQMAMAHEASAQHFLTDSFSAGHMRTPAGDIRAYWNGHYPLFWHNLRHKIANDTALHISTFSHVAYDQIIGQVEAMASELPAIMLGDLLTTVFHNVDSEAGLDVAGGGTAKGDWHLDDTTQGMAVKAMHAGMRDIDQAFLLGQRAAASGGAGGGSSNGAAGASSTAPAGGEDWSAIFAAVRKATGAKSDRFVPETMEPRATDQREPRWKAGSIEELWTQSIFEGAGRTVGAAITAELQHGSIREQLDSLAEKFPTGRFHNARESYRQGFVTPLLANPYAGVVDIVHWAPRGMSSANIADSMRDDLASLDRPGSVEKTSGMTPEQRLTYVRRLVDGGMSLDAPRILQLFGAMDIGERRAVYAAIDGHPWSGKLQHRHGRVDRFHNIMRPSADAVAQFERLMEGP